MYAPEYVRLPLDMVGVHAIDVDVNAEAGLIELSLEHAGGDRRSVVDTALARQLRLRTGGALHALDETTRRATVRADRVEVLLLDESGPVVLGSVVRRSDGALETEGPGYRLSPFELRYAADNGHLHPVPLSARAPDPRAPVTDLHTHFAGCVAGHDLVALGAEHGVVYPRALLEEAGVHAPGDVALASLPEPLRARLARSLEIPLDRRITFLDMERIYRLRGPLTKARAMFAPLCERIARDYAAMGVRRVELSMGSIVEAELLRAAHRVLPRIEEDTGTTIRFLVAISRHDDPEWDLDLVDRIHELAGSVYVAGVDFMGHETNSTRAFAPVIAAVCAVADAVRPGFVVRVHAGESPSHPENVRAAIEATRGHAVELRIGHGVYGVDEPTVEALASTKTVVELNLDSNVALNHVQSARHLNVRRYVDAGVPVVLGSDGYGIYRTSPRAAARAALLAGLSPADLAGPLAATEEAIIARARERERPLRAMATSFVVPDDPPHRHFTPAVAARRRELAATRDRELFARLEAIGVPVVEPASLHGREVISIAGAWRRSWEALDERTRARIARELDALVAGLAEANVVLLTGGTRYGVEGLVGRIALERGVTVVGALVRETPPASLEPGAMSQACIVGETLYDKAAGLYELLAACDGAAVFVAGGQIVSDEIQTAKNLRLDVLAMAGVGGASGEHAAHRPDLAFVDATEALRKLGERRSRRRAPPEPDWFTGPNPTVDAVVVRRSRAEILLVLRDRDAPAEAGAWALPGGFVASLSRRGEPWVAAETASEACLRELREETGLVVDESALAVLGVFEGDGRDPRDTPRSWSRTTVFVVDLDASGAASGDHIAGGDDAADARWFSLNALPPVIAFDHRRIIELACAELGFSRPAAPGPSTPSP